MHAECSPSQLPRIVGCPGSRRMVRMATKSKSSEYADEGTMLHDVTANRLLNKGVHQDLIREQMSAVQDCVDYFTQVLKTVKTYNTNVRYYIEERVSISDLPEVSGTSDVIIIGDARVDVIDWKFGAGVPVYAEENYQGVGYLLGAIDKMALSMLDTFEFHIHIVQPRLDYYGDWALSFNELIPYRQDIYDAVHTSREADAPLIPGEKQCRWCVGPACKAKVKFAHDFAGQIFEKYANKSPVDYESPQTLLELLDKAKLVSKFIAEIEGYLITQSLEGKVSGYKAVSGRSNRKWKNEKDAERFMLELVDNPMYDIDFDDIYKPAQLLSCAQAEKLHKKLKTDSEFKDLIYKPPGKPILVPENDPRPSIKSEAQNAFAAFAQDKTPASGSNGEKN